MQFCGCHVIDDLALFSHGLHGIGVNSLNYHLVLRLRKSRSGGTALRCILLHCGLP